LQKPEGFRVKASEGVVFYSEPSATQNLKSSGFPDVLGVAEGEDQRVNNMPKSADLSSSLYGRSREWNIANIIIVITDN
jgi:hypothetical protein